MLALMCALVLASDPPIAIGSPKDRQVFQRADSGLTEIPVEVVAPSRIGRMVATARPTDGGADLASVELQKTKAGSPDSTSGYSATLALPAGGWYRLAISVDGIAGPVEVARIERFGVGEVFVVAGQSNSSNSGEEKIPSLDDRVSSFDGKTWKLAADPMPGVQDASVGGSPWPFLGQELVAAWNVPIAFASCGYGGTSVHQWQKGADPVRGKKASLFDGLLERVKSVGTFRAILWHQGESDAAAGMSTDDYVREFRALHDDLAKDAGFASAWVVANVSFVPGIERAPMEAIRKAQQRLWKDKVALQGPDTDDLLGNLRHSQDHIHFSKAGLEAHAKRWAERLIALFEKS